MSSVSVVIPTLNEEHNIVVVLSALLRQTKIPDEIIVVDGGSTDGTHRIAGAYHGIKVLAGSPPVGAQRQMGLEAARGDIVFFLDADTIPDERFIERCLNEIESRGLDTACPLYVPTTRSLAVIAVYAVFNTAFVLLQRMLASGAGSCIITRKNFAHAVGGFRSDLTYEDIEFVRRASRKGHFGMLKTALHVSDRRFREHGLLRTLGKYMALSAFFAFGLFRWADAVRYRFDDYTKPQDVVVLVDENNNPVGTAPRRTVHSGQTPLHRGFSVFIFNKGGEVLLQQRSRHKLTWPLEWSNSCCGHPLPEESPIDAAKRRAAYELGLTRIHIQNLLPNYRYRAEKDGIVENETCPVMVGFTNQAPVPNPLEVEAVRWMAWEDFMDTVRSGVLTPWCTEEAELLDELASFRNLLHVARRNLERAPE